MFLQVGVNGQNLGPYGHDGGAGFFGYTPDFGNTNHYMASAGDLHLQPADQATW